MADLTQAALQVYFTGLQAVFFDCMNTTPDIWCDKVSTELTSDTELETYAWTDTIPAFRQWNGPRQMNNVPTRSRSIVNLDWENSVQIPLRKYQDDKHGIYTNSVKLLAMKGAKLHDQQLAAMIQANPIGYDGAISGNNAAFFSATHLTDLENPGSATQSNVMTTTAFTPSNYSAMRATAHGFLGRDGKPLYTRIDTLMHPPQLEEAVKNVLNSDFIAPALFGGQTQVGANDNKNNLKGTANPVMIDEFNNQATVWYGLDTRGPVRPFVRQIRQTMNTVYVTDPQAPSILYDKTLIFAADMRSAYDVALWHKAIRATA